MNTGKIRLQVRDYGGGGEPILFLHYGGGNLMVWNSVIPFFNPNYRVILCDLRGHGKSDKPKTGNDIDTMSEDVIGILNQLKIDKVHIVGSSLGAEVGLSVAANNPSRVISLVCEGAFHSEFGPFGTWEGTEEKFKEHVREQIKQGFQAPEVTFSSVDAYLRESKRVYGQYGWWNENTEAVEKYDISKNSDGEYTASWGKNSRVDYQRSYFMCRFEDYYSKLKCPLLITPGVNEVKNQKVMEIVREFSKLSQKAKIIEVEGWIHPYGWLIDSEEMCSVILKFIKEL